MNKIQKQAMNELEELKINHAETGRDREACYPSIQEEEEMGLLEQVIDGCPETTKEYVLSKLHPKCRTCCKLDLVCIGVDRYYNEVMVCYDAGPQLNPGQCGECGIDISKEETYCKLCKPHMKGEEDEKNNK